LSRARSGRAGAATPTVRPNGPSRESTAPEQARTREIPEPDAGISRAENAPDDVRPAERLIESKLDQLTKSRWIG